MPTPMRVIAEIAQRYGIDPDDPDAVERFYREAGERLSPEERASLLDEMLSKEGADGATATEESSAGARLQHSAAGPDVPKDRTGFRQTLDDLYPGAMPVEDYIERATELLHRSGFEP